MPGFTMRKCVPMLLAALCFLVCLPAVAFADFDYTMDLVTLEPIYKEYFADRERSDFSIGYMYLFEGIPDKVLQDNRISYEGEQHWVSVYDFTRPMDSPNLMANIKLGETLGLLRQNFYFDSPLSPISFDFSFQGVLNIFLEGEFADMIGYDGIYFYGLTGSVADKVAFRFGVHHYCTHYGDAILKRIDFGGGTSGEVDPRSAAMPQGGGTAEDRVDPFWITYKYVRMNDLTFGLSVTPVDWLRVYADILWPSPSLERLRPQMFAPNWAEDRGVIANPDYPDSYNARIVNFGIELEYPIFPVLGNTTIGYHCRMYEEGKVQYDRDHGSEPWFDPDAPWEFEHTITIGQQLNDWFSVEISYHNGRNPFNAFFYDRNSYVAVYLRCNPEVGITLFKD